ncbi:MAG TPA: glycosyl transferase family 1 [Ruminococcaceae bacterium]|jgi:glycosyltransferase involved in cell wall biosynthesis|nr:glycosyl transferase family 1 [Oscillospiraceae bacterium]HCC02392.1 glycosyl transferase family 1 [Oscillospiraceae bacterium]HCM24866.1 glycosyl transferase family 1 [Oscillospiraceae bacterium]
MKDCLVMLTKVYPFDKGEEFIEDEIPVLAKAFSQIVVIATSTADHAVQTRMVPQNVTVYAIRASAIRRKLPGMAARLVFSHDMHGFAGKDEKKAARVSCKARVFLDYFIAKSELVFEESRRILLSHHLKDFDGVTFYAYWFYDVAVAACQLKKYCTAGSCKAICRAHGYDLYQERQPSGYLPLRPFLLKNLDAVYPCSESGTQYILKYWPGFESKVHTAYLGTKDFGIGPPPKNDAFHIVSCCHIVPLKRVKLLAEALAVLKDSGINLQWTHIGGGDTLEELRAFAKENLSFMGTNLRGAMTNPEIMEFYQHTPINLFVNTSSSEGLPVSIMEAFSFGIPAIATDVGGTGELVQQEKTGWLLPADLTPEQLAAAIVKAVEQPFLQKQKMRSACRSLWEQTFEAKQNFEKFAQEIKPLHS